MTRIEWLSLFVCGAQLALAFLAMLPTARSPLATPLSLLCFDIFGWNAAELAYRRLGHPALTVIDHALSPLTAPLALAFVLVFVGQARARRPVLKAALAVSGLYSLGTIGSSLLPATSMFIGSRAWGFGLLALAVPIMAFALFALADHYFRSSDPEERARARLLLSAFAIATVLGVWEEVYNVVAAVPSLGNLGMLAATFPMAALALRHRLFERDISTRLLAAALIGASLALSIYLLVFSWLDSGTAILVSVAGTAAIAAFALWRHRTLRLSAERDRILGLAILGRFSAQMSHDLKNPLSALKGALQLLQGDLARPEAKVDRAAFVDLMLEQVDRMGRVIDSYRRLAEVEIERTPIDLNALLNQVIARASLETRPDLEVRLELARDLASIDGDADLLASVVENVVRNAIEAMPSGGELTIRTGCALPSEPDGVVLSIEDSGLGMDPRTRERAFDDFFTTKANGSGLGLAFARRVVEAHGGRIAASSEANRGTTVRIRLPATGPTATASTPPGPGA